MADLAGLLALLGIDYGSELSRDVARALAAILRGRAEAASGALARLFGAIAPATPTGLRRRPKRRWPASPKRHAPPGWPPAPRMDCATAR